VRTGFIFVLTILKKEKARQEGKKYPFWRA
jgi:hypothetical protein